VAADEIAALVADAMPYVTAAAGGYGGAVLAKTRDKAADATVGAGALILQRIFGRRKPGDPLPEPLAGVVAYPGDGEFLAALAAAVSATLEPSTEMLADVRAIITLAGKIITRLTARRPGSCSGQRRTFRSRHWRTASSSSAPWATLPQSAASASS
jgi:hypothetical protein